MKRIVCIFLFLTFIFSTLLPVFANEDIYAGISDYDLFYQGMFRVHPYMSYREFIENMMILDDAYSTNTTKFRLLVSYIEAVYYYGINQKEFMERLTNKIKYVDFNNIDLLYSAMFSVLDEFSYYIPAALYDYYWSPDSYTGVGITVQYYSDRTPKGVYISEVIYDSPAYHAGVLPGDRLLSADEFNFDGLMISAVNDGLLTALSDGAVHLVIERNGNKVEFDLSPSAVVLPEYSINFYPENKMVYLTISSFANENTVNDLRLDLHDIKKSGYQHIIIDLRDNSGGNIQYAMQIASLFLLETKELFTMYTRDGLPYIGYYSNALGYNFDKIYILTNENTASAAEAMTMVLDELADAVTVGTTTYGKAVGQSAVQLYDMSSIALTTLIGRGPSGNTYNGVGLKPDITVSNQTVLYEFPQDLHTLDETNYLKVVSGAQNDTILGFERRLEMIGYLGADRVDGIYDEGITNAINILQAVFGYEVNGKLDMVLVNDIELIVDKYKEASYINDLQFDTAYSMITDPAYEAEMFEKSKSEEAVNDSTVSDSEGRSEAPFGNETVVPDTTPEPPEVQEPEADIQTEDAA